MKIKNILLFSVCVCSPIYLTALHEEKQKNPTHDENCQSPIPVMQLILRHIESGGIGYNNGYTTLQGFFPLNPNRMDPVPYLDARAHLFDDGRFASNIGLGLRKIMKSRVWGMNAYYDYRHAKHQSFNQVGLGLESLGEKWDAFINGYIPVGSLKSPPYSPKFSHFEGNHLILSQKYEFAMYGVHGEAGYHIQPNRNTYLYFGAGPYYFQGPIGKSACGAMVRISAQIYRMVSFEIRESYDSLFHNHFQGQVGLSWAFGPKAVVKRKYEEKKSCPSFSSLDTVLTKKLIQPPERDEIVAVDRSRKNKKAIDPATNDPFFFYFVKNTSNSAGTFESPFPTLAQAESASAPNDVIYIFPGDGTTTGMDSGITLKNNQQLLGSGVAQPLQTAQGFIVIPPLSTTTPIITNTAGDGVTLAASCTLRGLDIATTAGNGVSGSSLSHLAIDLCTIRDSASRGINIAQTIDGTIDITRSSIIQNTTDGMQISASSNAIVTVNMDDCLVNLNGVVSGNGLNLLSSGNATYIANLNNSEFNLNRVYGMDLTSSSDATSQHSFSIGTSQFNANRQIGILAPFTGSAPVFVSIKESQINANLAAVGVPDGIAAFTFTGSTNTFLADHIEVNSNNLTSSSSAALYCRALNPVNTTIQNSIIAGQISSSGINYLVDNSAVNTINITGNRISQNILGISLNNTISSNQGEILFNLIGNNLDGNSNQALNFQGSSIKDVITTNINNNSFKSNSPSGAGLISISANSIERNTNITNNQFQSVSSGIRINFSGTVTTEAETINNNLFIASIGTVFASTKNILSSKNNQFYASGSTIFSLFPSGDYDCDISENLFELNNSVVFSLNTNSGSGNGTVLFNDNTIQFGTLTPAIRLLNTGAAGTSYSFEFARNEFSNINGIGIQANFSNSPTAPVSLDISNNLFSFSRNSWISMDDTSTSTRIVNTNFSENIFNNSIIRGIDISKTGTAVFKIASSNNTFSQNGSSLSSSPQAFGIVQNNGGSSTCLNLNGNSSDNGYLITNTAGTFNLAPLNVNTVNTGTISTSGVITPVASCP